MNKNRSAYQSWEESAERARVTESQQREYPDPTPEMLASPEFDAVWQAIKGWDICRNPQYHIDRNEPTLYSGATGTDVRIILDALNAARVA